MAKIDTDELEKMLKDGRTPKECAKHFSVSISAISHSKKKLNLDGDKIIDETIERYKVTAEEAARVSNEALHEKSKIKKALECLDLEISKAKEKIQTLEDASIGARVELFINGSSDSSGEDQIGNFESAIDAHQRFLERAPEIRRECERQLAECRQKISSAEGVEGQLKNLLTYRDLKSQLRDDFSEQKLFDLSDLIHEINGFEPDLFSKDFLPFFAELKAQYNSESRVLKISIPKIEDDEALDKFWRRWKYEALRVDILSRVWSGDARKGESLLNQMRIIASDFKGDGLLRDYNDVFVPALQNQNAKHHILNLR